jgi:hypothetical protein
LEQQKKALKGIVLELKDSNELLHKDDLLDVSKLRSEDLKSYLQVTKATEAVMKRRESTDKSDRFTIQELEKLSVDTLKIGKFRLHFGILGCFSLMMRGDKMRMLE